MTIRKSRENRCLDAWFPTKLTFVFDQTHISFVLLPCNQLICWEFPLHMFACLFEARKDNVVNERKTQLQVRHRNWHRRGAQLEAGLGGQLCELTQPQAKVRLQTAKVNRTIARECLHCLRAYRRISQFELWKNFPSHSSHSLDHLSYHMPCDPFPNPSYRPLHRHL